MAFECGTGFDGNHLVGLAGHEGCVAGIGICRAGGEQGAVEHPFEVGIESWVWDSIKSVFSAIGLETDNDSRINVTLPGNQPSPQYRAANTSEFYAGPEFRALSESNDFQ